MKKILTGVVFVIILIGAWVMLSEAAVSDISSGIVRLHIIANSDSSDDQQLKLAVRDRVLDYVKQQNGVCEKIYITSHLEEILSVCREEVKWQGYAYPVQAEVGNFYFPTKRYEQIMLPAGNYDAVRIVIGDGAGKNWWCVMYPPLCFTKETKGRLSAEEMSKLADAMSSENFEMIQTSEEEIELKPAFLLVEWWQEAKHALRGE